MTVNHDVTGSSPVGGAKNNRNSKCCSYYFLFPQYPTGLEGDEFDRRRGADVGRTRKRRNRELEEVPLGATLSDHVSNGHR